MYESKIIEETDIISDNNPMKKNKTIKLQCKNIKAEEECLSRYDCLFNKTRKCQKKPLHKKKTNTLLQQPEIEEERIIELESVKPLSKSITKLSDKSKSFDIPELFDKSKSFDTIETFDIPESFNMPETLVIPESFNIPDSFDVAKSLDKPNLYNTSACVELDKLRNELAIIRKKYDNKISECENSMFGEFITKYFNKSADNLTHKDLLVGLQQYYIHEKIKDINFILSMQEFIHKFSQKNPVKGTNYKRQHVFEAICRLLAFFDYDKDYLGTNKHFYKSLESFIDGKKDTINDKILSTKVNEGSASGIVDIFFKSKKNKKDDKLWACESISKDEKEEDQKDEYIMIQNKYYDKEKSNISNYDVTRIYTLANKTNQANTKFESDPKIILMVNNGDAVSSNLLKAKQQYPGLLDSKNGIIGISVLDIWFQQMLYDLYDSKTIDKFIEKNGLVNKPKELQLRFHQKFIIACTNKCIENNISKFIWGAVPRSGKSYMIGGLISERFKNGNTNNIVIILGALTETLKQFKDMFNDFSNFSNYKIITPDSNEKEGNLNIYLLSQEWLKDKVDDDKASKDLNSSNAVFNDKIKGIKGKYPKIFENGKIDLYFDEVHKGGSTDISKGIIHAFDNSNVKIDIFVMVTATFANPTLRYDSVNFIGTGNNMTEIIEWSYNDQQNMKSLHDETKKMMMINTRSGIQQEILNEIFTFYQEYYGSDYLNALSKEYQKHPELVLISPQSIHIQNSSDIIVPSTEDIRNVFKLKCSACEPSKSIEYYKNPANIFNQLRPVDDLLNFIVYHIYNYFKLTLKYPIDNTHTELWFLPDKFLYGKNTDCSQICTKLVEKAKHMDEDDTDKKLGIPNIEPLTRGLSIQLCKHVGFNKYNILIVHNTKLTYLGEDINDKNIFRDFKNESNQERIKVFAFGKKKDTSLAEQIKNFETESYLNGKSLIILTGAKLRLGISLPCADIAFNFDDIKSIDNNYQTMFRVLTERTKPELKRYGYYLDFNKERTIQFIYEYNKVYGEAKLLKTKEAVEALQSLLFMFNYNGLNLITSDTKQELSLYNNLISDLELNKDGYINYYSKKNNIVSLIKKSLTYLKNLTLLQELKRLIESSKVKQPQNGRQVLKKGDKKNELPTIMPPGGATQLTPAELLALAEAEAKAKADAEAEAKAKADAELAETQEEDYGELINTIAEELPSIIALLAIFSNDIGYECETIEECLQTNLDNIYDLKEQCNCENIDDASILDCFLNSPGLINKEYKYDRIKLEKIIQILLEIITSSDSEIMRINLNNIFDNIKELMTKTDGIIHDMSDKDIEEKIEQYLSVREEEKNKHGEVFTPIKLIQEMLDSLPKSVWSKPELKWLDPANGIGNFPMVVYQKLMEGLKKWEPNENKRRNHIIQNMLYMIEINPKNVKISKKIFGSTANICCANFETHPNKCFQKFGIDKFDIIIGNPPFQDEIKEKDTSAPRKGGKNKLYERITIQCLSLLNANGYLLFVTPDNIMTGNTNKAYEEIIKYNTLYINFNNIKKRYFPTIGQSMCYFLVQVGQKKQNIETTITNNNNENIHVIIKDRALNPITEWNVKTEKIIKDYISTERNNAVYNRGTKESDYTGNKYKVVYTPEKILYTNNESLAPALNIKKIILFESKPMSDGFVDKTGEYGVGPHTFYIPFETNTDGKLLERFFKSDVYKTLVKVSITSQYLKTSLISYLNLSKILHKRTQKTIKNQTSDDISNSKSSSVSNSKSSSVSNSKSSSDSKTKKQNSYDKIKKARKTKHNKRGGKNKTLKRNIKNW
jgi:hypothetical protein